jgi:sigma-B regulation protein RsbU (phosphoserine phosphatase)
MTAAISDPSHPFQDDLLRRRRLLASSSASDRTGDLQRLLLEVDAALERIEAGGFGSCEVCHGSIEPELLGSNPLQRVCLECLSTSERRALESDLELAAEVQQALLPRGGRSLAGWQAYIHSRAAGTVGGDFADLIEAPDGDGLQFVVGDVSGKGIPAALLASHLHALLRSSATEHEPLAARVARVNRLFSAVTPDRAFASLVWGRVDADGRGELVNAGHLPAMIVSHGGCRQLASTGVPVGLFAGARYSSSTFELAPGEQLVLVTDGVTESADEHDSELGVAGLWSLVSPRDLEISPEEVADRYLSEVARHRGGRPQHDDLTLMVLRRAGDGLAAQGAAASA